MERSPSMRPVPVRTAIRAIAVAATTSLTAGLLALAAPAMAARTSADHPPTTPVRKVMLRNGEVTFFTRTPATPHANARAAAISVGDRRPA
jgi:hypothetical protein